MRSKLQKVTLFWNMQGRTGIISIMIPVLFMIILMIFPGVYFETNDDKTIMEILSGVLTLSQDAHVIYMNYLLALPLSFLYRVNRTIPWYGCMMLSFHLISYLTISKAIYKRCRTWAQILAGTAFQVIFLSIQVYAFLQIQYTSTAALLAIAGYAVLILYDSERKGWFLLLEGLALLLRPDAFLMIQPFGMSLWLGIVLVSKERRKIKKEIFYMAMLVILFGIAHLGNAAGYGSAKWKEFERYNAARTTLVDYTGIPAYEDVKEILDRYQVTQATYEAIAVLVNGDVPVECMEELADYAKAHSTEKTVTQILGELLRFWVQSGDFGVARSVTVIMGVTLLWIISTKKYRLFLPYVGILASHVVVFGYLIYRGRMPYRVTFPLQACEALMFMSIMLLAMKGRVRNRSEKRLRNVKLESEKMESEKTGKVLARLILCGLGIALIGIPAGIAGIRLYRYSAKVNANQKAYLQGTYEILDYCNEHKEEQFLVEEDILMYATAHVFETEMVKPRNAMISHCWYSAAPSMREKWDTYFEGRLGEHTEESPKKVGNSFEFLRIIVREAEDYSKNPLLQRIMELTGDKPVVKEILEVSHGGRYAVIGLE